MRFSRLLIAIPARRALGPVAAPTTPTTSSSPRTGKAAPTSGRSTESRHHRRRDEGRPEVQHVPVQQEEVQRLRADVQGAASRRRRQQRRADPQHDACDNKEKFIVDGPQVDIGKGYWGSLYGEGVGGMMKASDPDEDQEGGQGDGLQRLLHQSRRARRSRSRSTARRWSIRTSRRCRARTRTEGRQAGPNEGIIAFQMHAGYPKMRVEFKDIKFTDLSKKK